jgi:hypothetical protein
MANRSIATSELVHVAKIMCLMLSFFIYFENSTINIEIRRMLYHIALIKVSET